MFTVNIEIDGLVRKLDNLAESAKDLEGPLRKFGAHLRHRAAERYAQQDFAPLAASTIKHRAEMGAARVGSRLQRQLRDAYRQGAKTKTLARREAALAAYRETYDNKRMLMGPHVALSFKQLLGINSRVDKSIIKAVSGPILGKLAKSLLVTVEKGSVTLASRTKEGWSDAHNKGDGHVPKRETIKVEEQDLSVLVDILKEHLLIKWE